MSDVLNLAAEVAQAYANSQYAVGADLYAPEWVKAGKPRPKYFFGDGGAIEAIRSGDPDKLRAALDALKPKPLDGTRLWDKS
jgi:hypothetical protein